MKRIIILVANGDIYEGGEISRKGRVVQLWNKYRRVTAIAASIAGITAIIISALFAYFHLDLIRHWSS